jgi:glycosyltransferase involved in cell wall biosynthesis
MKINLVLGQQLVFPPIRGGGVENLNWMLAREFARLGHEVVAYSRAVPELPDRETGAHGIRHLRLPGYPLHPNLWLDHLNALRWAVRLWPVLEPADVTTFHTAFSFLLRYRRGLGVCTHTIHRTPKPIVPLYRNLDRVYGGGDAVVQQALAIDPRIRNLKRVWNCIAIPPDAQPPTYPPRTDGGLRFLYVGRFVRDKGIESLIKGFELALKNHPANTLATVGPQTDESGADTAFFREMSAYIASHDMARNVELLPPIYDKAKLAAQVAAADVICVPSLSGETFSMAVLEGMAQAKPILVSDFGPMLEAIDHQTNGYVARAGDAQSMGEAFAFFSTHRQELPRLGAAAFLKARDHFSAGAIAREYLDDFRELIARKSPLPEPHPGRTEGAERPPGAGPSGREGSPSVPTSGVGRGGGGLESGLGGGRARGGGAAEPLAGLRQPTDRAGSSTTPPPSPTPGQGTLGEPSLPHGRPAPGGRLPHPLRITIAQGAFLPVPPLRGGAVEKVWFALGQEFAKRGHQVTHLSRRYPGLPDEEVIAGVRHVRVAGFDTPRSLMVLKALDLVYSLRVARQLPPADILVTNTFWLPILLRSAKKGRLYVHVARFPRGQMRFYRHAARLQTVSRAVMEPILAEARGPRSQVCTIPYPVLTPRPAVLPPFSERPKEILFVGRVHPEKGVHLLIEAFRLLPKERFGDWRLVIVGPAAVNLGGGGNEYQKQNDELAGPIASRVTWVGPVFDPEALASYFLRASLFAYPSLAEHGETFGLAPLEAMSQGCPALVSDLACFRDFISDEVDGFVFDHRADQPVVVLAEKLVELLEEPARLARASDAALTRMENYSLERIAQMYLDDFESLAAAPDRPA